MSNVYFWPVLQNTMGPWPVQNLRFEHIYHLLLLDLDHKNSSYRADSSSLKMKGTACTIAHILDGPDVAECVCELLGVPSTHKLHPQQLHIVLQCQSNIITGTEIATN